MSKFFEIEEGMLHLKGEEKKIVAVRIVSDLHGWDFRDLERDLEGALKEASSFEALVVYVPHERQHLGESFMSLLLLLQKRCKAQELDFTIYCHADNPYWEVLHRTHLDEVLPVCKT